MISDPLAAAPPAQHDLALADLLHATSMSHLMESFAGAALSTLWSMERTALLSNLKARGVDKLTERQKLATAIIKARSAAPAAPPPAADSPKPATQASSAPAVSAAVSPAGSAAGLAPAESFRPLSLELRAPAERITFETFLEAPNLL